MIKTCLNCGVNFNARASSRKYCCVKCAQVASSGVNKEERPCLHCGKPIFVWACQAETKKLCSRACKTAYSSGRPLVARMRGENRPCEICGKDVHITPSQPRKRFCSPECRVASRKGVATREKTGEVKPCATCGTHVYIPKGRLKKNNFCSPGCHDVFQGRNKVVLACSVCGVKFSVSPVYSDRKYCSVKCRDACPDFKRNCWIENNLQLQKRKLPTSLEVAGRAILERCGFKFQEQLLIANKFTVDALVLEKLIIQWDGSYWHGYRAAGDTRPLDARQARRAMLDKSQDAYMAKAGFTVLRFWEHDVKGSPDAVLSRISEVAGSLVEIS